MLIYIVVFGISIFALCGMRVNALCFTVRTYWTASSIVILLLSLLAGFRDVGIGSDTRGYIFTYMDAARMCDNIIDVVRFDSGYGSLDKGFLFLAFLSKCITPERWMFFFMIELAVLLPFFIGVYKLSESKLYLPVLLFFYALIFYRYNQSYNLMRQFCAIGWCFLSFVYYIRRRWLLFALFFFIAYSFHSSALIFAGLFVLEYVSRIRNRRLLKIMAGVALLLFLWIFNNYEYLLATLSSFMNDSYADRYSSVTGYYGAREKIGISDTLFIFYAFYLTYYSFKHRILSFSENIFLLVLSGFVLLSIFLVLVSTFINRIGLYAIVLIYWYLAVIMSKIKDKRVVGLYFLYGFLYWLYIYIVKGASETYPYTSEILGI